MATDTTDKAVNALILELREAAKDSVASHMADVELYARAADVIVKLQGERNVLAYEKGGHSLWKRYAE